MNDQIHTDIECLKRCLTVHQFLHLGSVLAELGHLEPFVFRHGQHFEPIRTCAQNLKHGRNKKVSRLDEFLRNDDDTGHDKEEQILQHYSRDNVIIIIVVFSIFYR